MSDDPEPGSNDNSSGDYDVIAPLADGLPWTELEALGELVAGIYQRGTVVQYHEYELTNLGQPKVGNVWRVGYPTDDGESFIEILNLAGFRSVTELQEYLDDLVAVGPTTRVEWLNHLRADQADASSSTDASAEES